MREWENRLLIAYLITDEASGERLTRGNTVQVAVDMKNGEMCFVSPPVLFERLGLGAMKRSARDASACGRCS